MSTAKQTGEVYKSRQVILEHLKNRGFDVSNYEGSSVNEVNTMLQTKQLDMLVSTPSGKKAYVKYHILKNLRAQNLYDIITDLHELENILGKKDDLIMIIRDEPNDSLRQTLRDMWAQDGVFVTVFGLKRLQYNIMNHTLVPPHKVLSLEEKKDVMKKFNLSEDSDLPDISRFSPVSMVIGIRPGEICEITRPSRTAVNSIFYRICSA